MKIHSFSFIKSALVTLSLLCAILMGGSAKGQITPTTNGDTTWYCIKNNSNSNYLNPTGTSGTYGTYLGNSGTISYWYFESGYTSWGTTYYYIHYSDGRHLYWNETNSSCITLSNTYETGFELDPNGSVYYIIPDGSSRSFNATNPTGLSKTTNSTTSWIITPVCKKPTISITYNGATASVTMSTRTSESIYYTTNGTTPTSSSSLYGSALSINTPTTINAIGVRSNYLNSPVASATVLQAATPYLVSTTATTATINCSEPGATLYYTLNGTTPTSASPSVSPGATITFSPTNPIKVIASISNKLYSTVLTVDPPTAISSFSELQTALSSSLSGNYMLTADIDASSLSTSYSNFTGTLDGQYHTISGLHVPLFTTVTGATIRNLKLQNVAISGSATNVGAIAGTATGNTRIYNCGVLNTYNTDGTVATQSTITGSTNVGSLVGTLSGNARVINCFSFANVSGTTCGGIVGNNTFASTPTNLQTLVMNCMFYGNVTGSASSPVYGGTEISNVSGINTYNFFRLKSITSDISARLKCAMPIEKDWYLNRFEFFRGTLNAERTLAAYYCFGDVSQKNLIGKWVLDLQTAPYPIIKTPDANTTKTLSRTIPNTTNDYAGKRVGTVDVTFVINGSSSFQRTLPVTDMDTARHDYTYGKIQLPFANEFNGWTPQTHSGYIIDRIIVGWEVTSITGGTAGTLTDYNFCDPNVTTKDLYTNSHYVFAQGGNFVVPTGVTAITLTAHWADAVYLSDPSYDLSYTTTYAAGASLGGSVATTYNGKTVQTSLSTALSQLSTSSTVFDQAIVLVGNFHYNQKVLGSSLTTTKPHTVMSIDADNDQEPDYCLFSFHTLDRTPVSPIRFDFLVNPGIGMVARAKNSTPVPSIGIWHSRGWFETTETYVGKFSEFEINSSAFTSNSPWIINGGIFDQIVTAREAASTKSTYFKIGGNIYIYQFHPGTHDDGDYSTTLCPINVSGGEIVDCYMTGRNPNAPTSGSVRFYCNGGYMHTFLGSYMAQVNGDVTAQIDHALINEFYGGGANANKPVLGNINITLNNSYVKFFCAGPKFGNMGSTKLLTTSATGTTFGQYYGAGYGGTCYARNRVAQNAAVSFNSDKTFFGMLNYSNFTNNRLTYSTNLGTCVRSSYEFFFYSGGTQGVARFYDEYATLSLAQTNNVTSTLTNCTIQSNFYGGGCQGRVAGNTTSTLTDCTVMGSAFGGGYTADVSTIEVYSTTAPTDSKYTFALGTFSDFGPHTTSTYRWVAGTTGAVDNTNLTIGTTVDMTTMGEISGNTNITINGGTINGSVFGGGNKSKVLTNTTVLVKGGAHVINNVYGGGNQAEVGGSTNVQIGD